MLTTQTSLTSYKKHPPTYLLYFRHSYDLTEHSNTMDNRNNQPKPELVHKLEGCTDEVNGAVILPGQCLHQLNLRSYPSWGQKMGPNKQQNLSYPKILPKDVPHKV